MKDQMGNENIAEELERIADLLEAQDANPHRVRAYRRGANRARNEKQSLAEMVHRGDGETLKTLPNIGEGLARIIERYVQTGYSGVLERLQGQVSPEQVFEQVPGIGQELAKRIANELDIQTLEELEQAAHDGRLQGVNGFGPKRIQNVQVSLAGKLSQSAQRRASQRIDRKDVEKRALPKVETLLSVDKEYRQKAEEDKLTRIAPKRFNPEGEAWLPILHTSRGEWNFTALFSNTARAHELERTHDWVVIYFEDERGKEDQATVVTATHGSLEGKRVIRGREAECERFYGL